MRKVRVIAAIVIAAVIGTAGLQATGASARQRNNAPTVFATTAAGNLIKFKANKDGVMSPRTVGPITGLDMGDSLIGIDFRIQDGNLYGVTKAGEIFTINTDTAVATFVDTLDVAPDPAAVYFGVDFNPAANALRIVSDTAQNLRHAFATTTTTADTALTSGGNPALGTVGAAYTNNDLAPNTNTTLFDIRDTMVDEVAIQSPANNGLLVKTGNLGVDTSSVVGFDIYSTVRNGAVTGNVGYASLTVGGLSGLYKVNLLEGGVKKIDDFEAPNVVTDIAVRPVPAPI